MRPTTILSITGGIILALGGIALVVYMYVERNFAKPWHFWIAPLLALGFAGMFVQLAVMYWVKVGRLETKGRPRSE